MRFAIAIVTIHSTVGRRFIEQTEKWEINILMTFNVNDCNNFMIIFNTILYVSEYIAETIKHFNENFSVSNPPTIPSGAVTTEVSNDALDIDDIDDDESSTDDENTSNSIHIFDKSKFTLINV